MNRRDVVGIAVLAGLGAPFAGSAGGQAAPDADAARILRETRKAPPVPHRQLRTTDLFASPEGYPNAIDAQPEGLWIGEQRTVEGIGVSNDAYLVNWSGKVLRKVRTESVNTSGMAFGAGRLWMGANGGPNGIFETSLAGRTLSHRQIPLGPPDNGGGCHGVAYHRGKLYIAALRLRGILRVDPVTWRPEFFIHCAAPRLHGLAVSDDSIWIVTAADNVDPAAVMGLARYDPRSGILLETASFLPGSADPHGLTFHRGVLHGCDAGIHPGWPNRKSPSSGRIFRIDFA